MATNPSCTASMLSLAVDLYCCYSPLDLSILQSITLGENALQFDNDDEQSVLALESQPFHSSSQSRYGGVNKHHDCW